MSELTDFLDRQSKIRPTRSANAKMRQAVLVGVVKLLQAHEAGIRTEAALEQVEKDCQAVAGARFCDEWASEMIRAAWAKAHPVSNTKGDEDGKQSANS